MLLVLTAVQQSGTEPHCRPFCEEEPCTSLNGDIPGECGGCTAPFQCRPGARGFDHVQQDVRSLEEGSTDCEYLQAFNSCPFGRWGQSARQYRSSDADLALPTARDCTDEAVLASLQRDCAGP